MNVDSEKPEEPCYEDISAPSSVSSPTEIRPPTELTETANIISPAGGRCIEIGAKFEESFTPERQNLEEKFKETISETKMEIVAETLSNLNVVQLVELPAESDVITTEESSIDTKVLSEDTMCDAKQNDISSNDATSLTKATENRREEDSGDVGKVDALSTGSSLTKDPEKNPGACPSDAYLCSTGSVEKLVHNLTGVLKLADKPVDDLQIPRNSNIAQGAADCDDGCLGKGNDGNNSNSVEENNSKLPAKISSTSGTGENDKSIDHKIDKIPSEALVVNSTTKSPQVNEANSDVPKIKDTIGADRKMGKAKKSCHTIKPKESKDYTASSSDLTVNTSQSGTSIASPISPQASRGKNIAKMSPGRTGTARISFSYASFKLPNLENRLGLSVKSFSELDAKTLDKIIMMRANNMSKKDGATGQSNAGGHLSSEHSRLHSGGAGDGMDNSCDGMTNDQPMGRSATQKSREAPAPDDEDAADDGPTRQTRNDTVHLTGVNMKSKARKSVKSSHFATVDGFNRGKSMSPDAGVSQRLNGGGGDGAGTARKAISQMRGQEEGSEGEPRRFKSGCRVGEIKKGDKREDYEEGGVPTPTSDVLYNVTPPATPTGSADSDHMASVTGEESLNPRRYSAALCCCTETGISLKSFTAITVRCQAIDSVDGKAVGCSSRVRSKILYRVSHRIPFMLLCETHKHRLIDHQCCPICGLFCTQGEFIQCRRQTSTHTFHSQCLTLLNARYHCPHCSHETPLTTTLLRQLHAQPPSLYALPSNHQRSRLNSRCGDRSPNAKFLPPVTQRDCRRRTGACDSSTTTGSIASTHSNNELTSVGLTSKDRATVTAIMDGEKVKKARLCVKSLFTACKTGDLERVAHLLSEGIDPNVTPDDVPYSALHAAARNGHDGIIELLIRFGANENARDAQQRTPLMYAAEEGQYRAVRFLLQTRSCITAKGIDGMTALHLAAKSGHCAVVQLLLETQQFDINIKDDGGWTALVWATEHGHNETVKYLLRCGSQPSLSDVELNTCLHWAAYSGNAEIAALYLNAGCSINCPNENGDRPLHISVRREHVECVALLLRRGADVLCVNKANQTSLMCCRDENSLIYSLLKSHAVAFRRTRERLLTSDISRGRENFCVSAVNAIDDENFPDDFLYISEHVETFPLNINRSISSLQACKCDMDCGVTTCTCSRQSVKCPYDKLGRLISDFNFADPPLIFECNRACHCHSTCQNRVIQMGITHRLEVFRTNGRGWGCRTLQDISQGSFVCEYFGELISDAEAERRSDDSYLFDLDSQSQDSDTFCIDAKHYGNVSRFINHLCEPNLIPLKIFVDHHDLRFPRMCFFATRDIKANHELGFDYGDRFWSIKWKQFTCKCQSASCRYSSETIRQTLDEYNRRLREEEGEEEEEVGGSSVSSANRPPPQSIVR